MDCQEVSPEWKNPFFSGSGGTLLACNDRTAVFSVYLRAAFYAASGKSF
jgi:hypothetical protein